MAASAYAALVSLSHVLEQFQHPVRHRLRYDRSQIETLHQMVRFMLDFFEAHSRAVYYTDEEDVLRDMANCINEAENVIDSHVVDQLSQRSADKADMGYSSFCRDIERVIRKLKRSRKVFVELREKKRSSQEQRPSVSLPAAAGSFAPPAPFGKNTMVGFDDHMARIKDQLIGGESRLQVVPIVGMGGIGKTTLAQNIFHHPCFKNHFDISIWFTISQEYRVSDILLGLLGEEKEEYRVSDVLQNFSGEKKEEYRIGLSGQEKEDNSQNIAELGQKLYRKLFGQRYLIILDDVWSTDVWDDLKVYFPNTSEGNRIIVTTRFSSISDSLGNENSYSVDLLDDKKSWELLCQKVFSKVGCPDPKLEEIGRSIASDCNGLPLAIVVIGGLLSKSDVTLEKWEKVARNVNSIVNSEDDEHCLNILSLSYKHLPIYLKPCFLYMRVYPEDYKIGVPQLIQSWIGEGFVISKGGKSLEEVAGEYLKDLIDRNLIFTYYQFDYWGNMKKKVGIHDLLRDLCIRENHRENTFRIQKVYVAKLMERVSWENINNICWQCEQVNWEKINNFCWLCGEGEVCVLKLFPFFTHSGNTDSEIYQVCHICEMICPHITLRLVEIMPQGNRVTTKLRYLDVRIWDIRFSGTWLHLFWNLRSIVFYSSNTGVLYLPFEIWNMPQLRHVKFERAILPEPPVTPIDGKDSIILEGLETLGTLLDFSCSEEIVARIPNVKKLKIHYVDKGRDISYFEYHNLTRLHKLESLTISWRGFCITFPGVMKKFPRSLKKLTLEFCEFSWDDMTIIGSLPNLEVLKLKYNAFKGESWNPVEGEFLQLKRLSVYESFLVTWNAEKEHFPKLESLILNSMKSLKNFPSGIGEIDTLLSITLISCPNALVNSAKEVVAEQQTFGNEGLQLHVTE